MSTLCPISAPISARCSSSVCHNRAPMIAGEPTPNVWNRQVDNFRISQILMMARNRRPSLWISLYPLDLKRHLCAYPNVTGSDMAHIIYKVWLGKDVVAHCGSHEDGALELWYLADSLSDGARPVLFDGPTKVEWIEGVCYPRMSYP